MRESFLVGFPAGKKDGKKEVKMRESYSLIMHNSFCQGRESLQVSGMTIRVLEDREFMKLSLTKFPLTKAH